MHSIRTTESLSLKALPRLANAKSSLCCASACSALMANQSGYSAQHPPSFTPLTHDFVGFLGVVSQYEDETQNLSARIEIGTFKPGQATGEFAALSKLDIAADYLIAARALTVEYGGAVAEAIDNALYALGQALRCEQAGTESPNTQH